MAHTIRTWAALALVVGLVGCSGAPTTPISADMAEFSFTPNRWTVPAGSLVELRLTNSGTTVHEWVVLAEGVHIDTEADLPRVGSAPAPSVVYFSVQLGPGASKTFRFTAPSAPGEYQVICGIPGHFDNGMRGVLVVSSS